MATPGGLVDKQELIDAQLDTAHLGRVVNSKDASGNPIDTSTNRTGGVNKTLDALEDEYQEAIRNAGGSPLNGGVWAAGQTFTAYNQFMVYNGIPYKPLTTVTLPYGPTAATPDTNFVGPYESFSKQEAVEIFTNPNLVSNPEFEIVGTVTNPPDATPRNYTAGDEVFAHMFAASNLTGVTYVNGVLNGSGQMYTDITKSPKQKNATSSVVASIAGSDSLPRNGATVTDSADSWRVTFDMSDTFSVKLEQGNESTKHSAGAITTGNLSEYTDINFSPSAGKSAVDNMIDGFPISAKKGARCSTGGTLWLRVSDTNGDISDFISITPILVADFGLDSAAFQSAIDLSFDVDFGGSQYTYTLDDPVGLPANDIRSDRFINIYGSGAKVLTDSAEAIFTSKATLLDPDTTDDLFSGSINFKGIAFSGKTPGLKTAQIFNADRLYNVSVTKCSFDDVRYIAHSYRQKGTDPSFAQGYMQSFFFNNSNRVHDVIRIFKGYRGFNISMSNNFLEGDIRMAMEIQSDFGTYAVEGLKIKSNVYEGGGLLARLGAVAGGYIGDAIYMEKNNRYTALDYHCLIMVDSSVPSAGLNIKSNHMLNSSTGDPSYTSIKFVNFTTTRKADYDDYWKGCSIQGNFCNTGRLVDRDCPIRDVNRNSVPSSVTTYKPRDPSLSAVDTFAFEVEDTNASGVATGVQNLFKFRFDSDPELSGNNRNFHVKVKARISHTSPDYPGLPTGKYQVGVDYFEFDLLFFYRQGFDSPFDTGMNFVGKVVTHIPAVGSAGGGAQYSTFFPNSPSISVAVNGTDYEVSMTGYVNNTDTIEDANGVLIEATVEGDCNWRDIVSIGDMRALAI